MKEEQITNEKVLEKFTLGLSLHLSSDEFSQLKFGALHINPFGDICLQIKREFWGEKTIREIPVSFKKPASAWQHFKEQYFPRALLQWFPVKYEIVVKVAKVKRIHDFPKAFIRGHEILGTFTIREDVANGPSDTYI